MPENGKLTICYHSWLTFSEDENFDGILSQIAERGFNCVRIEDGAGLLWDEAGKPRGEVLICSPFGPYTEYTTYRIMVREKKLDILDRVLRICRSAEKLRMRVILSNWFFLHTNWFCTEELKNEIFALSTERKMRYFAAELGRLLDVLRKEGLLPVIAFAELFNEFGGLPFAGEYGSVADEEAERLRLLHEEAISCLKRKNPDVLFAYDDYKPEMNPRLIPRNIDVLNFHFYYAWEIYVKVFERGVVCWSLEEPVIPQETRYFLKEDVLPVKTVADAMNHIETGLDWPRRISLYASIDNGRQPELTALLDREMREQQEYYLRKLRNGVDAVCRLHDDLVPDSLLVMGEGMTYCASPSLRFEADSEAFWDILREQMILLRDKGLWGAVLATTHAPGRIAGWETNRERYAERNRLFLEI